MHVHTLVAALAAASNLGLAPLARAEANSAPAAGGGASQLTAAAASAPSAPATSSYLLVANDYILGLQFYASGTREIAPGVGLTLETYFTEGNPVTSPSTSWLAEFDVGPSFTLGNVTLTATAGVAFDWAAKKAVAFLPQVYTVVSTRRLYVESWAYAVLFSTFGAHANDYLHTRDWVLYKITDGVGIGPQAEITYNLNGTYGPDGLVSFPVGARVDLGFAAGNTLGLFLGYETRRVSRGPSGEGAVGRVSFLHNF